jgi:multidrug efflux pump subunit AcrA (membrane-fusion protein)
MSNRKKTTAAASQQSQRERLLRRPRPSISYRLVVDPDRLAKAREELDRVKARTRQTLLRAAEGSAEYRRARRQLDAAQAEVDSCYETIVLRALPTAGEVTVEKLKAAHPPTPEQLERAKAERDAARRRGEPEPPWPEWNEDTFPAALLAACAESDMTEDDWRTFLGSNVSTGEYSGLWQAVLAVNALERVADPLVLPKDWMGMLS